MGASPSQIVAAVGEVEALVAEREIGDLLVPHGHREAEPVVERRIDDFVQCRNVRRRRSRPRDRPPRASLRSAPPRPCPGASGADRLADRAARQGIELLLRQTPAIAGLRASERRRARRHRPNPTSRRGSGQSERSRRENRGERRDARRTLGPQRPPGPFCSHSSDDSAPVPSNRAITDGLSHSNSTATRASLAAARTRRWQFLHATRRPDRTPRRPVEPVRARTDCRRASRSY